MPSNALPPPIPIAIRRKAYLIVGDLFDTLGPFIERHGRGSAALIHIDIGSGDEDANRSLAGRSPLLEALLQPGGLLLGDRAFDMPSCRDISAETNVPEGRYFVYRKEA